MDDKDIASVKRALNVVGDNIPDNATIDKVQFCDGITVDVGLTKKEVMSLAPDEPESTSIRVHYPNPTPPASTQSPDT